MIVPYEKSQNLQSNLSSIRMVLGMTSQDLADEMEISRQLLSRIESGARAMTKIEYLAIRAIFYDVAAGLDEELYKDMDHPCVKFVSRMIDNVPYERYCAEVFAMAAGQTKHRLVRYGAEKRGIILRQKLGII